MGVRLRSAGESAESKLSVFAGESSSSGGVDFIYLQRRQEIELPEVHSSFPPRPPDPDHPARWVRFSAPRPWM